MKAMMKQVVAANSVGIISTPNQPMYRRFSVLVTQSQKRSHTLPLARLCKVVVIALMSAMNEFWENVFRQTFKLPVLINFTQKFIYYKRLYTHFLLIFLS
ncbi:hypothetical protein CI594_15575 [Fischerella thermalis CCMEE 5196]|nr:hypothetical protein CI594_15575 [Fischerella thermalis CCMEE 5196]